MQTIAKTRKTRKNSTIIVQNTANFDNAVNAYATGVNAEVLAQIEAKKIAAKQKREAAKVRKQAKILKERKESEIENLHRLNAAKGRYKNNRAARRANNYLSDLDTKNAKKEAAKVRKQTTKEKRIFAANNKQLIARKKDSAKFLKTVKKVCQNERYLRSIGQSDYNKYYFDKGKKIVILPSDSLTSTICGRGKGAKKYIAANFCSKETTPSIIPTTTANKVKGQNFSVLSDVNKTRDKRRKDAFVETWNHGVFNDIEEFNTSVYAFCVFCQITKEKVYYNYTRKDCISWAKKQGLCNYIVIPNIEYNRV